MTRYFAVRTDGCGGYLNAQGKCVDRGWVISTNRSEAQQAANAAIAKGRKAEVRQIKSPF